MMLCMIMGVTSEGVFYGFAETEVIDQFKSCCVYVCVSVAEAPGAVKVTEWQQSYYGTDSGIQSGATTVRSDEEGTEYSTKKFTYTTTITENPAGKKHHMLYTKVILLCSNFSVSVYQLPLPGSTLCNLFHNISL